MDNCVGLRIHSEKGDYLKRRLLFVLLLFVFDVSIAQQSPVEKSFAEYETYRGAMERGAGKSECYPFVIRVTSQKDLEDLTSVIKKAIKDGQRNIEILIDSGTFYYDKVPVSLSKTDAKDVSINIKGNTTKLIAGGKDYLKGSQVSSPTRSNIYLDINQNLIDLYGEVFEASGVVEILDKDNKKCRMAINQSCSYSPEMRIQVSEWYKSPIYKVTDVRGGYVYFDAHDLGYDKQKKCYNVQYDNSIASIKPRYRFIEVNKVKSFTDRLHECSVSQFIRLKNVKLKSFSVSGIEFCGCAKGDEAFIALQNVEADQISIADCQFEYMRSRAVNLKNTGNLVFKDNIVSNCYAGALYTDVDCPRTIVKGNRFFRAEKGWTNSSCVVCYGDNFLIADNVFEDISYSSIRTGYHHSLGTEMISNGVIEDNEIFYGNEYYGHPEKYSLIDGGGIYIGTLCKQVIVRYNYIHNYRGVKSNRAIYCDDGAMNVKIYGNVISGVTNAHSVLSWRAKSINKKFPQSNDGIDFYYNVIWGKYKFDERPNSSCIHGKNLILYGEGETPPENVLKHFAYQEEDYYSSGASMVNGKIKLSVDGMKVLKTLPTYPKIKQWFYDDNARPLQIRKPK